MHNTARFKAQGATKILLALSMLNYATVAAAKLTPSLAFSLSPAAGIVHASSDPVTAYIVVRPQSSGDPMPSGTLTVYYRDSLNTLFDYCSLTIDTSTQLQTCVLDSTPLPAGTDNIVIGYSGDANYDGDASGASYGVVAYPVAKATLSWTATAPALVLPEQPASYRIRVDNPGDATGYIQILLTTYPESCSVAISNDGYCTLAPGPTGTTPATLKYAGDANYNPIAETSIDALVVTPFPATMTLSALPTTVGLGDTATLSATVSISDIFNVALSGSVTVSADNVPVCTMPVSDLTCAYQPTSTGTKTLLAHFTSEFIAAPDVTTTLVVTNASVDGQCGSDNGATLTAPPTHLCSAGTPSVITGNGPWVWSCVGSGAGSNASCSANKAGQAAEPGETIAAPTLSPAATVLLMLGCLATVAATLRSRRRPD